MKKKNLFSCATAVLLLLATPATAQQKQDSPPGPKKLTPLEVQIVFTKYQGAKKLSSLPYTLTVNAGDNRVTRLRLGIEIPVKGAEGKAQYRNVGTNIDCSAEAMEDRFKVNLNLEQSSVYSIGGETSTRAEERTDPPLFQSFSVNLSAVLGDGQTVEHTAATDPVTGEVQKISVTLKVLK
jgi:hypothetical protein